MQRISGEYWRRCDRDQEYPSEFVQALTEAGFLGALIPEEYEGSAAPRGAAILEEIHRSGGNAGACHAQMYTMGTLSCHGSKEQKDKYLPAIARGELVYRPFGVTEPTSGTDTPLFANHGCSRRPFRGQWSEDLDLPLTVFRSYDSFVSDHPARRSAEKTEGLRFCWWTCVTCGKSLYDPSHPHDDESRYTKCF